MKRVDLRAAGVVGGAECVDVGGEMRSGVSSESSSSMIEPVC